MKLYDSLTQKVSTLTPLSPENVTFYACGPTVYDYTHIGHIRKYTMDDILKRSLIYHGYNVKHVMNITDVGHLTGDDDSGEDKLEKGASKSGRTVWDVAKFYTTYFEKTIRQMNILPPSIQAPATQYIQQMITMIQTLEEKGFTYETNQAVYFNVTRFANYGNLSRQPLTQKRQAVREGVQTDPEKKHPADFALWFKRTGRFQNHVMHWISPWGDGFPGWHIECSAMSTELLGTSIDIHSGGIDHIPVHHENEIAQSESATGKTPFVQFWVHHNFLRIEGEKMSKSLHNFLTIDDIKAKQINPFALRYLFLQTHYRQEMNFTWESIQASQEALNKIHTILRNMQTQDRIENKIQLSEHGQKYQKTFSAYISEDLQIPRAVALMWSVIKDRTLPEIEKRYLIYDFDTIFGLQLDSVTQEAIPEEMYALAEKRQQAKKDKDYKTADTIRNIIQNQGYQIDDHEDTFTLKKKA